VSRIIVIKIKMIEDLREKWLRSHHVHYSDYYCQVELAHTLFALEIINELQE